MVINDFNGFRASIRPEEAQAELVVDADAVLTGAIASQGFQLVAWRDIGTSGSPAQHRSAARNGRVTWFRALRGVT